MAMPCFFEQGDSSNKRGLNGQPIKEYRPIDGAAVAEWKAMWRKIEEGISITSEVFVAFLRIHHVTADGCTCANHCTFAMCEGVLPCLLVKEPNFKAGIETDTWLTGYPRSQDPAPHKSAHSGCNHAMC